MKPKLSVKAKNRLTKFIAFMNRQPKEADQHFNMCTWFGHYGQHTHGLKRGSVIEKKHLTACGTVACALGWAATMPEMKRIGLTCVYDGKGFGGSIRWKGKGGSAFFAGAKAFDIEYEHAEWLFCGIDADSPKEWAREARIWMRSGTPD